MPTHLDPRAVSLRAREIWGTPAKAGRRAPFNVSDRELSFNWARRAPCGQASRRGYSGLSCVGMVMASHPRATMASHPLARSQAACRPRPRPQKPCLLADDQCAPRSRRDLAAISPHVITLAAAQVGGGAVVAVAGILPGRRHGVRRDWRHTWLSSTYAEMRRRQPHRSAPVLPIRPV